MDRGLRAAVLLSRPVCFRDIRLGVVVDVIFDARVVRALGLDVLCGDRTHRFLPQAAYELDGGHVRVESALVLISDQLDFYRRHGRSLAAVRGFPVRRGSAELGTLADLVVSSTGEVEAFILEDGDGQPLPIERELTLGPDALRPAV